MLMNRERESRKRPRGCWDIDRRAITATVNDPALTRATTGS